MSRGIKGIVVFSVLGGIIFLLIFAEAEENGKTYENISTDYSVLQFEQECFHLGKVESKDSISIYFRYKNIGKVPLIIKNIRTTCGCVIADWNRNPLVSGESDTIKIIFIPEHDGFFQKSLDVVSNTEQGIHRLLISGKILDE